MYVSTKSFFNYSCSHRQWRDDGHCAYVHGYDRSFHFWFAANKLTEANFVMHFGKLKEWKQYLDDTFDHALLLNQDDPLLSKFEELEGLGACKLTVLPNVGMEGTSLFLWNKVNDWLLGRESGRVCCFKVETREHEKNSAYYEAYPGWFAKEDHIG